MSNELTPQIAGAYYGCRVETAPYGGQPNRKLIGEMIGITSYGISLKYPEWQSTDSQPFANCKLLLRPLSAITDDDCAFIYETIIGSTIGENRFSIQRQQGKSITVETVYNIDNAPDKRTYVYIPDSLEIYYTQEGRIEYPDGVRMQEIIDYLRSKGYDCGRGSIPSLISAGIAVEDKTERI